MSYPLEAIAARYPDPPVRIREIVQRFHARPAFQRALGKGGPYEV